MANCSPYRCVATSIEGFLFQLAVSYVTNGKYYFYVTGSVPSWRTPTEHDARMLSQYEVAISKFARCRRRKRIGISGRRLANCQYLRFSDFWILLCQEGENAFFDRNCKRDTSGAIVEQWFYDVRQSAIQFNEYSVGYFKDKLTVRLSSKAMAGLRSYYLKLALKPLPYLREELATFPYEAYGGVLKQRYSILRSMNLKRGAAGLPAIPTSFIRKKRKPVKPFMSKESLSRETLIDSADLSLAA